MRFHWLSRVLPQVPGVLALILVVVLAIQNRDLRERQRDLRRQVSRPYPGLFVPTVRAQSLTGDTVVVGATDDRRRQVVFFFTTSCKYCLQTLPQWKKIAESRLDTTSGTYSVLGISLDSLPISKSYYESHALNFPVALFQERKLVALYRAGSVPLTLVLSSNGQVLMAHEGPLDAHATVDSLIKVARRLQGAPIAR